MKIKPWQMLDARLDHHKAYMVGDTVYPGQGIPGVTLSGIIAAEKLLRDWDKT
jgi:phytoene dehydrogenase-like protein